MNGAKYSVVKKVEVVEKLLFYRNETAKFHQSGSLPQRLMSAAASPQRLLMS
jgi:hypothetical protein